MDIITLNYVVEQLDLIKKEEFITESDVIRWVDNLKNNLESEIDMMDEMMYEEMHLIDSDGTAFGQVA